MLVSSAPGPLGVVRTESRGWGPDLAHGAGSLFLRKQLALAFPEPIVEPEPIWAAFDPCCRPRPQRGQRPEEEEDCWAPRAADPQGGPVTAPELQLLTPWSLDR